LKEGRERRDKNIWAGTRKEIRGTNGKRNKKEGKERGNEGDGEGRESLPF